MKQIARLLIAIVAASALAGCGVLSSIVQGKKVEYKTAGKLPPLEVPPDLTTPQADDRYAIPEVKPSSSTTYSEYSRDRTTTGASGQSPQTAQPSPQTALLPAPDKVRLERAGSERWLVVKAPPEQVWPEIKSFLESAGYQLKVQDQTTGIIETEWRESHPLIPEGGIRGALTRALGQIYSSGLRDKYRVRLERGAESATTEIYVSHRGMEEVFVGTDKERTMWQPQPPDPEAEAEMLSKLLAKFGSEEAKAMQQQAQVSGSGSAKAQLASGSDGERQLLVSDPFDRAWRRVGLALDRVGFTVEDRDRSKGLYFVRYIDPRSDGKKEEKGWLSKLAFWRSDDQGGVNPKDRYRIRVSDSGAESRVDVQNSTGTVEKSPTAERILSLLFDQLK
jgi:outer membrane protein assembly factor BamC